MKRIMSLVAVMTMFSMAVATGALAQQGMCKGSGGWGPEAPYSRMYDPQTVETITGEVVSVDTITPSKGMSYGIHIVLKTDNETIPVHLGPGWYIENQDMEIEPGDNIEVKGSRIIYDDSPALIAAQVWKGDEVLTLRDENGFPVWSGWRRR